VQDPTCSNFYPSFHPPVTFFTPPPHIFAIASPESHPPSTARSYSFPSTTWDKEFVSYHKVRLGVDAGVS